MPAHSSPPLLPWLSLAAALLLVSWGLFEAASDPAFALGTALPLAVMLAVAWIFGIRYRDVGWLLVVLAALASQGMAQLFASLPRSASWIAAANGAFALGGPAFLLAFLRLNRAPRQAEALFVVGLLAWGAVCFVLPDDLLSDTHLGSRAPAWVGLLGTCAVLWRARSAISSMPNKRQRLVAGVLALSLLYALAVVWASHLPPGGSAKNLPPALSCLYATCLSLFLFADLLVFHRSYYRDKSARIAERERSALRAARFELGRAVRDLLLPKVHQGLFAGFNYEFVYRPTSVMGGDWMYIWTSEEEVRLFFGDVEGSGPQAALGVAAIMSLIHEGKGRHLGLVELAAFLNVRLLDLFNRQLTTSFQAVSLARDGTVELANAGGTGFFVASRNGGRHLPLPSAPLGFSTTLDCAVDALPLHDGTILFAATNGLIDGGNGVRRLLDFFDDEIEFKPSQESVRATVLALAPAVDDDRTLLLIERPRLSDDSFGVDPDDIDSRGA